MSTVQNVIDDIRVEVNDTGSTRFTDDSTVILPILKQAIRRANRVVQRAGLHFGKKSASIVCTSNQDFVTFSAAGITDLDIPLGLYRDDTHEKIEQRSEDEWQRISSAAALENWFLDLQNSKILFKGTPTDATVLTLWYFPVMNPSAYTVSSTMPWGGILDDVIARYVALRLQNLDEMDVSVDQGILADMEQSIITTYAPQNPTVLSGSGWL